MTDVYSIASIGFAQGQQRLDAVSLNAANATLPGYRRQIATSQPFNAHLQGGQDAGTLSKVPVPGSAGVRLDLRAGQPVSTGRPLDFAIDGDDLYFGVTDGSSTWLTRAGSFRVSGQGVLTDERGLRVLGVNGDINLPSSEVTVAADGQISHNGSVVGALQLFRADEPAVMAPAGGALLSVRSGYQAVERQSIRLRSGYLESSNTDNTQEMLGLVTLSRQFESLVRLTQGYDEILGKTIQKLGDV